MCGRKAALLDVEVGLSTYVFVEVGLSTSVLPEYDFLHGSGGGSSLCLFHACSGLLEVLIYNQRAAQLLSLKGIVVLHIRALPSATL